MGSGVRADFRGARLLWSDERRIFRAFSAVLLALLAAFLTLFLLFIRFVPMIAASEVKGVLATQKHQHHVSSEVSH